MIYSIYNNITGEIESKIICPENMIDGQLGTDESYLQAESNDSTQYIPDVNTPVITGKPANTTTIDKTTVTADGVDFVTLSNVPANAKIAIQGQGVMLYEDCPTTETITFDDPGDYEIEVTAFPYLPYTVTIDAT